MTAFHIKIIAILTMVIDHVGLFFFPDLYWMRMVGRLSFPLFAWLIANGAIYTKNAPIYLARLIIFAALSQIPYELVHQAIDPSFSGLNIFFTLSTGLVAIITLKTKFLMGARIAAVIALAVTAEFLQFSYGAYGVLMVALFYIFFRSYVASAVSQTINNIGLNTIPFVYEGGLNTPYLFYQIKFIQPLGLLSLPIIFLYNGKKGPGLKYFFYFFYPIHLLIIYFILTA